MTIANATAQKNAPRFAVPNAADGPRMNTLPATRAPGRNGGLSGLFGGDSLEKASNGRARAASAPGASASGSSDSGGGLGSIGDHLATAVSSVLDVFTQIVGVVGQVAGVVGGVVSAAGPLVMNVLGLLGAL